MSCNEIQDSPFSYLSVSRIDDVIHFVFMSKETLTDVLIPLMAFLLVFQRSRVTYLRFCNGCDAILQHMLQLFGISLQFTEIHFCFSFFFAGD
jgi:hypothetical protein